jgi:hypothetical protein
MGMEKTMQTIWSALTERMEEGKESTDVTPRLQARVKEESKGMIDPAQNP